MSLNWFLARRYLASRKRGRLLSFITFIALGGVTVGVSALVLVIGVMTGMQHDLQEKILASNAHIVLQEQGQSMRMRNWQSVLDSVRKVDGVTAASPFIVSSVGLKKSTTEYSTTALLFGVLRDTTTAAAVTELEEQIRAGIHSLETPESGLPPMLVGSELANRIFAYPGDTLVIFGLENMQLSSTGSFAPSLAQFEVTGSFTTGMYDTDAQSVYVRLEDAQRLLGLYERDIVSAIGIQTADPMQAEELSQQLAVAFPFPYVPQSWFRTNAALFSALKLEKLAMGLILFLIVLVAAFNIVSTLVMVVSDRTREIGILKSMGMTDRGILKVFIMQGAWIGIVGTALGTTLGLILAWVLDTFEVIKIPPDVYFVDRLPVQIEFMDIATIVLASVAVAFVATIYPAIQASRLQPVEAIRDE